MPGLINMAGDEFWKAPLGVFIERLMPVDCWIGWDSVVCTPIFGQETVGGSDAKLHYLLSSWDMSVKTVASL
jgi:hypothetical protein